MVTRDQPVYIANGHIEAEQVRAFLEEAGILSELRSESLSRTHALTVGELGKVEVLVAEGDVERANELLAAVERGDLRLDDEEPDPEAP